MVVVAVAATETPPDAAAAVDSSSSVREFSMVLRRARCAVVFNKQANGV